MKAEYLDYFKALIEGQDTVSWLPWWRTHEATLKAELPRTEYLQLKFGRVKAAADILRNNGIEFEWSAKGRREAAYANLHPSAVDEFGHPLASVRAKAYNGALTAYLQGETEEGNKRLGKFMRKLRRQRDEVQRSQELADFEFDGEQLCEEGQQVAAIAILQAVARWETDSDLEMPFVHHAQKKLREIGQS